MNKKDLQVLTLVGPTRKNPVSDPLAVLYFDSRLLMIALDSSILVGPLPQQSCHFWESLRMTLELTDAELTLNVHRQDTGRFTCQS